MNVVLSTLALLAILPINDGQWHRAHSVTIQAKAGQVLTVMGEQEVSNPNGYLVMVGSAITATGISQLTASMAHDIPPWHHMPISRMGMATIPADGDVEVVMWLWAASSWGSGPVIVEGPGYGELSVSVR